MSYNCQYPCGMLADNKEISPADPIMCAVLKFLSCVTRAIFKHGNVRLHETHIFEEFCGHSYILFWSAISLVLSPRNTVEVISIRTQVTGYD